MSFFQSSAFRCFLFIVCLLHVEFGFAQQTPKCHTDELLSTLIRDGLVDPEEVARNKDLLDQAMDFRMSAHSSSPEISFHIPLVFYVPVSSTTTFPYSTSLVQEVIDRVETQIDNLNSSYNPHGINFCLAEKLPNGDFMDSTDLAPIPVVSNTVMPKKGIYLFQSSVLNKLDIPGGLTDLYYLEQVTKHTPAENYIRIIAPKETQGGAASGIGNYPWIPGFGSLPIVSIFSVLGDADNCAIYGGCPANRDGGKVLIHEVGHYLGLYHTFERKCEWPNDEIADTPPMTGHHWHITPSNVNDPTYYKTCPDSANPHVRNYMDYADDSVRDEFTNGQATVMRNNLSYYYPTLYDPQNLANVGITCPDVFALAIVPTNSSICKDDASSYFEIVHSTGAGKPYSFTVIDWGDNSGSVASSITGLTHNYTDTGTYTIRILGTDASGDTSYAQSRTIYVANCTVKKPEQSNWAFGSANGLSFSTGQNPGINGSFHVNDFGAACVSNSNGDLLFYTDGDTVWDALGGKFDITGSSDLYQGVTIIPKPNVENNFLIVTIDNSVTGQPLYYTEVSAPNPNNVNIVGSSTGVSTSSLGVNSLKEAVVAIPKCEPKEYWIITKEAAKEDNFVLFETNGSTISLFDTITISGSSSNINRGTMAVSTDGQLLATLLEEKLKIFAFDNETGDIFFYNQFDYGFEQMEPLAALSFSPDNSQLYFSGHGGPNDSKLFQLHLSDLSSDVLAGFSTNVPTDEAIRELQITPDNRIFGVHLQIIQSSQPRLSVINFPNEHNTDGNNEAGFDLKGLNIDNTSNRTRYSIPNMLDASHDALESLEPDFSYTLLNCSDISVNANSCTGPYAWNFGDSPNTTSGPKAMTHSYSSPGTYTVTGIFGPSGNQTVISKTIEVRPLKDITIDGKEFICSADPEEYSASIPDGYAFDWTVTGGTLTESHLANTIYVEWSQSGTIDLEISTPFGCEDTVSLQVDYEAYDANFALTPFDDICKSEPVALLNLTPFNEDLNYNWSFGSSGIPNFKGFQPELVTYSDTGTYTIRLTATDNTGCANSYSKQIKIVDDCCEHDYEIGSGDSFGTWELGEEDEITEYSGGEEFDGVYLVKGSLVLTGGDDFFAHPGTIFYIEPECNDCTPPNAESCAQFNENRTGIFIDGANFEADGVEFRSVCGGMWKGITVIGDGNIEMRPSEANVSSVRDALVGIATCNAESEAHTFYQVEKAIFTNNIFSVSEMATSLGGQSYVVGSYLDSDSGTMKNPYNGFYSLAGIALMTQHNSSDGYNSNYLRNNWFGIHHYLAEDPTTIYSFSNNTFDRFFKLGCSGGGKNQSNTYSLLKENEFIFLDVTDYYPNWVDYNSYEGGIDDQPNLGGYSIPKSWIIGAYTAEKNYITGNKFFGNSNSRTNASITTLGLLGGGSIDPTMPDYNYLSKNEFHQLDTGTVYYGIFSGSVTPKILDNKYLSNEKGLAILGGGKIYIENNEFGSNEVALEIDNLNFNKFLTIENNAFSNNDTALSITHNGTTALDITLECNRFDKTNSTTYDTYGLFVHDGANLDDIGGDGITPPINPVFPAGNAWPVDPDNSPGYPYNTNSGTLNEPDVLNWAPAEDWYAIYDANAANENDPSFTYYSYNNEFVGEDNTNGTTQAGDAIFPSLAVWKQDPNDPPIKLNSSDCPAFMEIPAPQNRYGQFPAVVHSDFKLYPNPGSGRIGILGPVERIIRLSVHHSVTGKTEAEFDPGISSLDLGHLSPGIYVVRLELSGSEVRSLKLIINH